MNTTPIKLSRVWLVPIMKYDDDEFKIELTAVMEQLDRDGYDLLDVKYSAAPCGVPNEYQPVVHSAL